MALRSVGVDIQGRTDFCADFAASTTEIDGRMTQPLANNTSPEEKRKIIGDTFMRVTQAMVEERGLTADNVVLAQVCAAWARHAFTRYLHSRHCWPSMRMSPVQGTLRPDLIESGGSAIGATNAAVT